MRFEVDSYYYLKCEVKLHFLLDVILVIQAKLGLRV
jgi:hypothetical protein